MQVKVIVKDLIPQLFSLSLLFSFSSSRETDCFSDGDFVLIWGGGKEHSRRRCDFSYIACPFYLTYMRLAWNGIGVLRCFLWFEVLILHVFIFPPPVHLR